MKDILRKVHTFLLLLPAALLVVVMRLLKPWVRVRLRRALFYRIASYPVVWYLFERQAGLHRGCWDVFYVQPYSQICNKPWFTLIRRQVRFFSYAKLAHVVHKINDRLPGSKDHAVPYQFLPSDATLEAIFRSKNQVLSFSQQEEALGQQELAKLGIPKGRPFICFFSRDAAYLKKAFPMKKWDHHDYRDTRIESYVDPVMHFVNKGYYAVRMGSAVEERFPKQHPQVIDYAANGMRTEFLDVYLGAKCHFFLGSDSGINIIPETFKRPVIYANWVSIATLPIFSDNGLVIMKKWYSTKENRFWTLPEILRVAHPHKIDAAALGVKFIDNTAEEMIDAAQEMEWRIKGMWQAAPEDEELQARFWALYDRYGAKTLRSANFRIGSMFLRQHRELLEEAPVSSRK